MNTTKRTSEKKRALKVRQIAEIFQVQPGTVLGWIKRREVEAVQLPGGQYRIPASEVDRLLQRRGEVGP